MPVRFRIPTWYLLVLLSALLVSTSRATSLISSNLLTTRDDDDDDDSGDDSDGDGDGKQHHGAGSNGSGHGTLTKHHVSGGAIAGIVIGVVLLLVLFLLLSCWCLRRRRNARAHQAGILTAAVAPSMTETSTVPLLNQHSTSLRPQSSGVTSPTDSGGMFFTDTSCQRSTGTQSMRNIAPRALDTTPLPNPYDGDTPPQPPPHDGPPSPASPLSSVSRYTSLNSSSMHSSNRQSTAPSAWTHDESGVALLSRGTTHTSRISTASTLHDELSGYQKQLEAHHRKEEEDAVMQQLGEGSGVRVPADPPPVYSPSEER